MNGLLNIPPSPPKLAFTNITHLNIMPKSKASKVTDQQWEDRKNEIVKLYFAKSWPLKLVRQELATEEFSPK